MAMDKEDILALAGMVQGLINNSLIKAGLITGDVKDVEESIAEVVQEKEVLPPPPPPPPTPEFVVSVNGELVPALIQNEEELQETIAAVVSVNADTKVEIYVLDTEGLLETILDKIYDAETQEDEEDEEDDDEYGDDDEESSH